MRIVLKKFLIFQLLIVFTSSGCATDSTGNGGSSSARADMKYRGSDCILIRTIRDYRTLDDSHLLISGGGRRTYFVTLLGPVFEMRGSASLRFESRDDQLCPFGGDSIIFGTFGRGGTRIQSISRITAEQEEEILLRFGLIERTEQAPPDPGNVTGAEVEELD